MDLLSKLAATEHVWTMPAIVDRVIDGDTVVAHIMVMPGMSLHLEHIRVEGINAPELNTGPGKLAKAAAEDLMPFGTQIMLSMTHVDKYGRVLAKIRLPDGRDFGQTMLDGFFAVPYIL